MSKSWRRVLSFQFDGFDPLHCLDIEHFDCVSKFFLFAVLLVAEASEEDEEGLVKNT
jgi:hypothetical protein